MDLPSMIDTRPPPAAPAAFNLAAHVLAAGIAAPGRVALVVAGRDGVERWRFGRLVAAVTGVAGGLRMRGLRPGDRVLLRLPDGPEVPVAFLGAIAAGLVPMPSPAALAAGDATALSLRLNPAAVVAGAGVAAPEGPWPVIPATDLRAMMDGPPGAFHPGPPDRPAYVVATSGTSGQPSLVVHAHRAMLARRMMHQGWEGLGPADRVLHAGAMGWTYTLGTGFLDPWTVGATAILPQDRDAAALALLARRHDATILAAVPGVFRRLLRSGLPPLPRLRHGLSAGEALPPALRAEWRAATGTDLHEALGMSEVSTWVSGSPHRPAPEGWTGWPQAGRRVAVLGADGRPVPRGQPGVLAVDKGDPGLALGLLDDAEGWAARFRGGWFLTGDLGVMRADGAIRSLGRADEVLNPGGHRIGPAEVEAAFAGVPGMESCAAAEVALPTGARVLGLLYAGSAGIGAVEAAAQALSPWKRPRIIARAEALPVTRAGKLDRRAVAAALAAGVGPC